MVSTWFLSARANREVNKKCSLLGKFISDGTDRSEYEEEVRQHLTLYLRSAEKVKLKVGRHAVTITDRTIRQNKIDRIPNSLIVDAYVDSECPQICYFVNETVRDNYQVIAFLCKSVDDAHQLVNSCRCYDKEMKGYSRYLTPSYRRDSTDEIIDAESLIPIHVNQQDTLQHSTMQSLTSHGNYHTAERQPGMRGFVPNVQRYDSGKKGYKVVQSNNDGVARIMIGDGTPVIKPKSSRGLTHIRPSSGSKDTSLQRVSRTASRSATPGIRGERQMSYYPVSKQYRSRSSSPTKRYNYDSRMVEEEFKYVPFDTHMNSLSLPRRSARRVLQTSSPHTLNMVRSSSEETSNQRRQAPYKSIQEYEAAQKNMTVSSSGRHSSGLHTTTNSENIAPHMSLVMQGNNYHIRNDTKPHRVQPIIPFRPKTWQTSKQTQGLQIVRPGKFPVEPHLRSKSSEGLRARTSPNIKQARDHLDIQPEQMSKQLQLYTPPGDSNQPKYRVQTHGKGENFLKNEAMEYDDDHRYFRQHGQRVRKTSDGRQQLFLDKRLAETSDVIGSQFVQGRHSQKVHSGESTGANHCSKFHSEVRVSHKTSQPAGNQQGIVNTQQALVPHRKNSQPVRTTTHQWPPAEHFDGPTINFNNNLGRFQSAEPLQRFFRPEYDPTCDARLNPGFERFFSSIDNFGPQSRPSRVSDIESKDSSPHKLTATSPANVERSKENESETSSIRSSASAYWPPELKFLPPGDESDTVSWKFRRPVMKLRRISPPGDRRER